MFMYSQSLFGARWFLPKSFRVVGFDFYKNKSEVISVNSDAENYECVICLFSLFSNENFKYFVEDFVAAGNNNNNNSYLIKAKKCSIKCKNFSYLFFEFHEYCFNLHKKEYMMTPCKHFFHTDCLEAWFKQKKECPSCRQDIRECSQ